MLENLHDFAGVPIGPNTCKVQTVRAKLSESDKAIFDKAVKDVENFSTHSLHLGLRQLGVEIGYQTLARHRKNICSCGRADA